MQFTTADLIGQYIKLRDAVESKTKAFQESMQPYQAAMQAIEGAVSEMIAKMDGQSVKTDQGTAYRSTVLAVRCADRESLFEYVKAHDAYDLLTSAVAKDAVKDYLEKSGGSPPPGVDVAYVHKTNFRRV
jgi:uncharacterized membrane-anchored protein YhcB (DUF1043 family)